MLLEDLKNNFETIDKETRIRALKENISSLRCDRTGFLEIDHLLTLECEVTAKREPGSHYLYQLTEAKGEMNLRVQRKNYSSPKAEVASFEKAVKEFKFILSQSGV